MDNQTQGPVFAPIPVPGISNPIGNSVVNALFEFITKSKKDNRPPLKKQLKELVGAEADFDPEIFGKDLSTGFNAYNKQLAIADSALSSRNKEYDFNKPLAAILSQGKFGGVKLTKEMVDEAVVAAKKAKMNPLDLLAIMGQESTFSQSKVKKEFRTPDQRSMTSGWNTSEGYEPYKLERFLADKQIPGVVQKNKYGKTYYSIEDLDKVKEALAKRPGLIQQYIKKVQSTPIAEENFLDMAAKFVQKKGIKSYNPGDPNYEKDVMNSKSLLQRDPQLMKYLRSIKL